MKIDFDLLIRQFDGAEPGEFLAYFLKSHAGKIAFASSFGAEDQVVTDMIAGIDPTTKIFTLDTGRLHDETYRIIDRTRERYGIAIEVFAPDTVQLEQLYRDQGMFGFRESVEARKRCCSIRKLEPLGRALKGLDVWITGLRRAQSPTRESVALIEWDETHHLIKLNPLIDWSEEMVWDYIREHKVPYNALHDLGYPSIGCAPCTRAISDGEDIRAGRWWWENPEHKECGLHVKGR